MPPTRPSTSGPGQSSSSSTTKPHASSSSSSTSTSVARPGSSHSTRVTEHPYPRPQNNTGAGTSANAKKNKNQKNQPDVQALIGSWPETVTPGYTPLSLLSLDGQEKGRGKGKEKEKAVGASKGGEEGSEEGGKGRMKLDREEKSRFVQEVRVGGTNDGRRRGWGTERQLLLLFSISFLLFIFLFIVFGLDRFVLPRWISFNWFYPLCFFLLTLFRSLDLTTHE